MQITRVQIASHETLLEAFPKGKSNMTVDLGCPDLPTFHVKPGTQQFFSSISKSQQNSLKVHTFNSSSISDNFLSIALRSLFSNSERLFLPGWKTDKTFIKQGNTFFLNSINVTILC